jgi:uncharacterized protein YjbJ (UPF0337 family)
MKGQFKQKWGKLTDDNLLQIKGKKDVLVGQLKQAYGLAKEEAEKQIEDFRATLGHAKEEIKKEEITKQ